MCIPGERGIFCVPGVVVWSDDLPSQHVVPCQEVDVTSARLVGGEGDPVKAVD